MMYSVTIEVLVLLALLDNVSNTSQHEGHAFSNAPSLYEYDTFDIKFYHIKNSLIF